MVSDEAVVTVAVGAAGVGTDSRGSISKASSASMVAVLLDAWTRNDHTTGIVFGLK